MRNQLNELKPCEIHLGHFTDYCITGFMKQMQCNVTPSLNIIETTAKQVWLSVLNIRRTTRPGYTGTTTILQIVLNTQKPLLKSSHPKKYLPIFLPKNIPEWKISTPTQKKILRLPLSLEIQSAPPGTCLPVKSHNT